MKAMSFVSEIAVLLVGVAVMTLLVNNAANTVEVIKASTGGFDRLLKTVTLQADSNGYRY